MRCILNRIKKEDSGLRGDFEGNLYIDKRIFFQRKEVRDVISRLNEFRKKTKSWKSIKYKG